MNWFDYYLTRVNSDSYQKHFSKKYMSLIVMINKYIKSDDFNTIIIEEGCGIGSVTKELLNDYPFNNYILMDNDEGMLELAKINLKNHSKAKIVYRKKNILDLLEIDPFRTEKKIVVTHGVLEHFSDSKIIKIINTYSLLGITQFHYVPTSGYSTPSFGDERLMDVEKWKTLTNFTEHVLIDGKDLYFKIN